VSRYWLVYLFSFFFTFSEQPPWEDCGQADVGFPQPHETLLSNVINHVYDLAWLDDFFADESSTFFRNTYPSPFIDIVSLEPSLPTCDAAQAGEVSASESSCVRCKWGGACGMLLTDVTPRGIGRHIREFHFNDSNNSWYNRSRGCCQWSHNDGKGPCGKEMFYEGYAKHIACVHLGSVARSCPDCGRTFSRSDALRRHSRDCRPK